ncbi:MAG: CRISPR-associated endonuclease Cas2 [Candidatus Aenigmarchaeota archaeon]|nr:CRISPR-associated endonuclease Cas2 [Candidatus Aenigmarchaeota archaeon]MBU5689285.1 CRISPR-associated endonuclease Cas2 [Candidatus Aenigmarchaeota archaeon]
MFHKIKFSPNYLFWNQNSVFEVFLTVGEIEKIKNQIQEMIDLQKDSVLFYILKSDKFLIKENLGLNRNKISTIL